MIETVKPFRWTADAYYKAADAGLFTEKRVQLIDGEIIEMAAQKNYHALGTGYVVHFLSLAFGPHCWVRDQKSLDLSPLSVPDPDAVVIAGSMFSHAGTNNPRTALLVVEVADTTLSYDRNTKASLYAASGIADYWILNLVDRQLEVYRDPIPDASKQFGYTYASRTDLLPGAVVSPLALPGASVAVADLLP